METLGSAFAARGRDRDNNFLLLRLFAASLVVYGHCYALVSRCTADCRDLVTSVLHYRYAGDLGLHVFFVISGFLVTASFAGRRDLASFVKARALRIFPGLVVCIAVLVLLGAALTTLSATEYWSSVETRRFFLTNASLRGFVGSLPGGVFAGNKASGAVNGSLWTLWIEARLYLAVALLGLLGVIGNRRATNVVLLGLALVAAFAPSYTPLIGMNSHHLRLGAFFSVGAALYANRDVLPLRGDLFAVLAACAALSLGEMEFEIFAGATVCYGTFLLGFARKIRVPRYVEDYSYGIYLYGWPTQQLIAHLWPEIGPYAMMAIALPASWGLGALSWHLVEKRALALKHFDFSGATRTAISGLVRG